MSLIEIIVSVLSISYEVCTYKYIIDRTNERRDVYAIKYFFIIYFIIVTSLIININPNVRVMLCMCLSGYYFKQNYKVTIPQCLIFTILYWLLLILVSAISITSILYISNETELSKILDMPELKIMATCLGVYIIYISKNIYLTKLIKNFANFKVFIWVTIPMIVNIIFVIFVFTESYYDFSITEFLNVTEKNFIVFFVYLITFSNFALLITLIIIVKNKKLYSDIK